MEKLTITFGTRNWMVRDCWPLYIANSIMNPFTHLNTSSARFMHHGIVISYWGKMRFLENGISHINNKVPRTATLQRHATNWYGSLRFDTSPCISIVNSNSVSMHTILCILVRFWSEVPVIATRKSCTHFRTQALTKKWTYLCHFMGEKKWQGYSCYIITKTGLQYVTIS